MRRPVEPRIPRMIGSRLPWHVRMRLREERGEDDCGAAAHHYLTRTGACLDRTIARS